MKNKCIQRFVSGLMCISLVFSFGVCATAFEETRETVRVGYFDLGKYYTANRNGTVDSYDSAFLSHVSEYSNLDFEYVYCETWDKALEMLDNHEIDLVGTMQWTAEREEKYAICDASYGYSVAELASLESSNLIYEDFSSMNGLTVGFIEGYAIEAQLQTLIKKENINFNLKKYADQKTLDRALENGEIDIIAANAHAMHDDWKILEKFNYSPFYFASSKDNEQLTQKISEAIIKLNIHQSNLDDVLIREYFPRLVNSPYTKEEMDCIEKNSTYTIYFDENTKPLVWYDSETRSMTGVIIDVCNRLTEITGIKFNYKMLTDQSDLDSEFSVSYKTGYYDTINPANTEDGVTDSFIDQRFEMYHRVGRDYQTGGAYKIAIMRNRDGVQSYLKNKYPNCSIVEYDSPQECMKELNNGKVNLAFLSSNVAENAIITDSFDEITPVPMTDKTFGISLKFNGENAQLLSSVINKGIKLLNENVVNESMIKYALSTSPVRNLSYMIHHNLSGLITNILVVVLIIVIFITLFIYALGMKKQKIKVEKIDKERSDFFARMSHDMRTPMNGILGMIELSEQTSDIKEVRSNLKKAKSSCQYMLSLINDTLDFQRLEAGKMAFNMKCVKISSFIEEIIDMVKSTAQLKNIELKTQQIDENSDCYVKLDPIRVNQIFINLISNAIKFTPSGGTVCLSAKCLSVKNDYINMEFLVSDTGIGMSHDFIQNNLFKAYSQEPNKVSNKYAGSGLGLAITKNLVELMGGNISVSSELGQGTEFKVELSFETVENDEVVQSLKKQQKETTHAQAELGGKHILLCEDNELNAEIAKRILENVGCIVSVAENGEVGVDLFQKSEEGMFDLILMDIRMPVLNGLDATKKIRALKRTDAITVPIIAISANAYDEDIHTCINAGMNAHLAKPIEPNSLYETMAEYINKTN